MKKVEITFFVWGRCIKTVEVDDDYELQTDNSIEFMEELQEEYPEEFDDYLMTDDLYDIPAEIASCDVDQIGMDYIDSVRISDSSDNQIDYKEFKKIQVS